jgi:hypothetical protein
MPMRYSQCSESTSVFGGIADMAGLAIAATSVAIDPTETSICRRETEATRASSAVLGNAPRKTRCRQLAPARIGPLRGVHMLAD